MMIAQDQSEAHASPIMTNFTTQSAFMNMASGLKLAAVKTVEASGIDRALSLLRR
jgi:hypothetical protein